MSDGNYSIFKVATDPANRAVEPVMSDPARQAPAAEAKAVEAKAAEAKAADAKTAAAASQAAKDKAQLPLTDLGDIRLKYHYNPDTKQVSVMVIDRASKKVIRTIPPDELKNFREGDLLELTS